MNEEKQTKWNRLYVALLIVTFLMIIAMLIFQTQYQ